MLPGSNQQSACNAAPAVIGWQALRSGVTAVNDRIPRRKPDMTTELSRSKHQAHTSEAASRGRAAMAKSRLAFTASIRKPLCGSRASGTLASTSIPEEPLRLKKWSKLDWRVLEDGARCDLYGIVGQHNYIANHRVLCGEGYYLRQEEALGLRSTEPEQQQPKRDSASVGVQVSCGRPPAQKIEDRCPVFGKGRDDPGHPKGEFCWLNSKAADASSSASRPKSPNVDANWVEIEPEEFLNMQKGTKLVRLAPYSKQFRAILSNSRQLRATPGSAAKKRDLKKKLGFRITWALQQIQTRSGKL